MKRLLNVLSIWLLASPFASADNESLFYQEGKIYVVVAVLSIIFLGLAVYLIRLDMKVSKLEKRKNQED